MYIHSGRKQNVAALFKHFFRNRAVKFSTRSLLNVDAIAVPHGKSEAYVISLMPDGPSVVTTVGTPFS